MYRPCLGDIAASSHACRLLRAAKDGAAEFNGAGRGEVLHMKTHPSRVNKRSVLLLCDALCLPSTSPSLAEDLTSLQHLGFSESQIGTIASLFAIGYGSGRVCRLS